MITMERTVRVDKPTDRVFDYLADFTNSTDWDPGTISTVLIDGDGSVGSRYRNTSKFAGRVSTLIYQVREIVPGRHIHLRGENSSLVADDRITVQATNGGSEVIYRAEFDFRGVLTLLTPVLRIFVKRLGDAGARGIADALQKL